MKLMLGAVLALAIGGCATASVAQTTCPAGQEQMRTAQLFFGRDAADAAQVTEADFRKFVDEELTPAFPAGLTVLDGGGQWRGAENQLIREASKVVIVVMPNGPEAERRISAVRAAYKARFNQQSVLLVTQSSCVAF